MTDLVPVDPLADARALLVAGVPERVAIVPHGVEERFRCAPREQRPLEEYSTERPFRLLYVSIVDVYKHQWHVAEAVRRLRDAGLPVVIDFVGPGYGPALARLKRTLRRLDPEGEVLRHRGAIPFEELHRLREQADLFVFASSCENMPNILLEAMAAGYPIACARRAAATSLCEATSLRSPVRTSSPIATRGPVASPASHITS